MGKFPKGVFLFLIFFSLLRLEFNVAKYNPTHAQWARGGEFTEVYRSAVELKKGNSPFAGRPHPLHPLLYFLILQPFTYFKYKYAAYFFYFSQFIIFPAAIFFLVKAVSDGNPPPPAAYGIAAILAINSQPLLETLSRYKVEGLEFFLISLALLAFKRKKDLLTGALLFIAFNLKYYPGILIVYFMVKRELKVLAGVGITALVLLFVLAAFYGLEKVWFFTLQHPFGYFFDTAPTIDGTFSSLEWQSLHAAINRLSILSVSASDFSALVREVVTLSLTRPWLSLGLAIFLKIFLGGLYFYFIRNHWAMNQREEKWPFYLLEISLTLLMLPVFLHYFRHHYGILILPAFVITGLVLYQRWNLFRLKEKILFGTAYFLSGVEGPPELLYHIPPLAGWAENYWWPLYLGMSFPFYGYLLLGGCVILCSLKLLQLSSPIAITSNQ